MKRKNIANIGDIVVVDGYPGRKFRVESYTYYVEYTEGYITEDVSYIVYDIETGEDLIAFQDEITVIQTAHTSKVVRNKKKEDGRSIRKWEQLTRSEKIDYLLDELRDYQTLIKMFGDENNEYKNKIELVKKKLEELSRKGAR